MKKILLTITLLILVIGCTEKVYTFDDLRNIGFEGGDGSSVIESNRFVGTYEYVISEGNAMELTRRYPVLLNVIANRFEDTKSANEYKEFLKSNPQTLSGYHKCFINNLYIGLKKDPNYSNYQKVCDFIAIDIK